MQLFYTKNIQDRTAFLQEEEARHCVQVLRHQIGDEITLIDGVGGIYEAEIIEASKKKVSLVLLSENQVDTHRKASLHIAIAPTKNINRMEWFLEKATEMGIDEITPILCQRSERKVIKPERLEKILLTAAKQSKNIILPRLHPMVKFKDFIKNKVGETKQLFIAHCEKDNKIHLFEKYQPEEDVVILIGPEGDFSMDEIKMAFESGFEPISLGKSRLRTETAGVAACHTVNLKQLG